MGKDKKTWEKIMDFSRKYVLPTTVYLSSIFSLNAKSDGENSKSSDAFGVDKVENVKIAKAYKNEDIKKFIVNMTMRKFGENIVKEHEFALKNKMFSTKAKKYTKNSGWDYCQGAVSYSLNNVVDELNAKYLKGYINHINRVSCQKFIASTQNYSPNSVVSGKVKPNRRDYKESVVDNTNIYVKHLRAGDNLVYHDPDKKRLAARGGKSDTGDHTYAVTTVYLNESNETVGAVLYSFNNDRKWLWGEATDKYKTILPEVSLEGVAKIGFGDKILGRLAHLEDVVEVSLEKDIEKNIIFPNRTEENEEKYLFNIVSDMGFSKEIVEKFIIEHLKSEDSKVYYASSLDFSENNNKIKNIKSRLSNKESVKSDIYEKVSKTNNISDRYKDRVAKHRLEKWGR